MSHLERVFFMGMSASRMTQLFGIIVISTSCVDKYSFEPDTSASRLQSAAVSTGTLGSLKTYKPALAVRGAQCMVCHASLQTNIITDFGYGSANFAANPYGRRNVFRSSTQIGATLHHTNDSAYGNQRESWQSANAIEGQIIIPRATISSSQLETMVGLQQEMSLKDLMEHPTLTGSGSMVSKVTSPSSEKVIEKTSVTISYPTKAEILALLPTDRLAESLVVYEKTLDSRKPAIAQNLILDTGRSVVRNDFTAPIVICRGDIVVKGTLLLKNAVIFTDKGGCRLYVTEGIHIQGTLTLQGPSGENPNVQMTSPKAILMGFDADSMGAASGGGRVDIHSEGSGRLSRFGRRLDTMYNPSVSSINGMASASYFNDLTTEAVRLGDYLEDAVEAVTAGHVPTGATVVNGRLSINYSGLLLNAPQVHSRYYGDMEGAVITDIAFFARNPAGQNLERFLYDSVFDDAPTVFPALSREMLSIQ